jgi:hypothetical protein
VRTGKVGRVLVDGIASKVNRASADMYANKQKWITKGLESR